MTRSCDCEKSRCGLGLARQCDCGHGAAAAIRESLSDVRDQRLAQVAEEEALEAVKTLLRYIGEDPTREGLTETPERVLKAWRGEWGAGYHDPPKALVKLFTEERRIPGGAWGTRPLGDREMILVDNIAFYSHCEHHMAPFFGVAHIGYIASEKGNVGLSKMARIVEHFSRRLQVQERLTSQIADFIKTEISEHCGVVMRATHMCMSSRGVNQQHAQTSTASLKGAFLKDASTRAEFLALTRNSRYSCD
jgi:GTP cyclohydrolase I